MRDHRDIYLAGYFYDTDGRATWLSSGGRITDPYSYSGTLQWYHDGQSVFGAYRPPAPAIDFGPVSVTFSDDSHGILTWPGGRVQIERQQFGEFQEMGLVFDPSIPLDLVLTPKTGWWWNSDESGSGYSVEIQGNQLFIVAFMYTESGEPIWYFSAGPMSSPTHFESDWLELSGGQTLRGPYRLPTSRTLGRVTIDFAAEDSATIVFKESSSTASTATARKSLKTGTARSRTSKAAPQLPRKRWSASDFPPYFACKFVQEIDNRANSTFALCRKRGPLEIWPAEDGNLMSQPTLRGSSDLRKQAERHLAFPNADVARDRRRTGAE